MGAIALPPPFIVLLAAAVLDFLLGDPWNWPHPVRSMGWVIHHYTQWALRWCPDPRQRQVAVLA